MDVLLSLLAYSVSHATGVGVLFGAISLGGKSSKEERETSLTKVKFSVPIVLP